MAKKLLVKTPQTTDGLSPDFDDKKQVIMKETIVELGAKKLFEQFNSDIKNKSLRHEFEEIEVDDETGLPVKATKNAAK